MDVKNFNPLNEIGFIVSRTRRMMLNTLEQRLAESDFDITAEQAIIIMKLYQEEGVTQQEIADVLFKDKSSIKRLIDNMESKNLILRVLDKKDRRNKLIYLTHGGKMLREKIALIIIHLLDETQKNIEEEEMEICKKVLNKIFKNLSKTNHE